MGTLARAPTLQRPREFSSKPPCRVRIHYQRGGRGDLPLRRPSAIRTSLEPQALVAEALGRSAVRKPQGHEEQHQRLAPRTRCLGQIAEHLRNERGAQTMWEARHGIDP